MMDKVALTENIVMIVAFVAAVDGCALYSLKRALKYADRRTKAFWISLILLLPAIGALAFFFFRPSEPAHDSSVQKDIPLKNSPQNATTSPTILVSEPSETQSSSMTQEEETECAC